MSVQFSRSVVCNSVIPWTAAPQASQSITNSWSLLKLMSVESVMPSDHLILCHPLLLHLQCQGLHKFLQVLFTRDIFLQEEFL